MAEWDAEGKRHPNTYETMAEWHQRLKTSYAEVGAAAAAVRVAELERVVAMLRIAAEDYGAMGRGRGKQSLESMRVFSERCNEALAALDERGTT